MRHSSAEEILTARESRIERKAGPPAHATDQRMRVLAILRFVPERLKELPQDKNPNVDWYERATGRKRPTGLPLFDGAKR